MVCTEMPVRVQFLARTERRFTITLPQTKLSKLGNETNALNVNTENASNVNREN